MSIEKFGWRLIDNLGAPITGANPTIMLRNAADNLFDWNDLTFKSSGWITKKQSMIEVDSVNLPGVYNLDVNLFSWTGLYYAYAELNNANPQYDTQQLNILNGVLITPGLTIVTDKIDSSVLLNDAGFSSIELNLAALPAAVRTELSVDLAHLAELQNGLGLSNQQATVLLEMYELLGLDPTKPLVVTSTTRTAGTISQAIDSDASSTVVTRI